MTQTKEVTRDFYARSHSQSIRPIRSCRSQILTDALHHPGQSTGASHLSWGEQAVGTNINDDKRGNHHLRTLTASSSSSCFCFLPPKAYSCKEALLVKTGDSPSLAMLNLLTSLTVFLFPPGMFTLLTTPSPSPLTLSSP